MTRLLRVAVTAAALLAVLVFSVHAAEGIVQGQVVNGTDGGATTLGNLPVQLHLFQGTTLKETRRTTTDAQGMFRFEGMPTGRGWSAVAVVVYAGVEYGSKVIDLAVDTPSSADIKVYETTTDGSTLSVERSHLLVEMGPGYLGVTEMVSLVNSGNRTYVGSGEEVVPGRRSTAELRLPAGATDAQFQSQEDADAMLRTGKGFVDTRPIVPGRWVYAFSYVLPYEGSTYTLLKPLVYDTATIDVFIDAPGAEISAPGLEQLGSSEAPGRNYLRFGGSSLRKGSDVVIRFSGLGQASQGQAANRPGAGAPTDVANGPVWYAAGMGAIPLLVVAALGWLLVRALKRPVPGFPAPRAVDAASALTAECEQGLAAMAELDERYEAGEISEAAYRRQRQAEKARVLNLMLSSQGGESDTRGSDQARAAGRTAGAKGRKEVRTHSRPTGRRPKAG